MVVGRCYGRIHERGRAIGVRSGFPNAFELGHGQQARVRKKFPKRGKTVSRE